MKPNLINPNEIIEYLKEIKVEPYYIQDDYLQDLVDKVRKIYYYATQNWDNL